MNFLFLNTGFVFQMPLAGMVQSYLESNTPGKVIIMILFLFSIWAWTVMASKLVELKKADQTSNRFLRAFREEPHPLKIFLKGRKLIKGPLIEVYQRSCDAVVTELEGQGVEISVILSETPGQEIQALNATQIEGIRNIADRNVADQILLLEKNVNFLATAVSTTPFLGLLGTVWGVMDAFSAMAKTGAPTLSAVAPGISAALLTTIVALLVALPSAFGYNMITNKIRTLSVRLDNFAQELVAKYQHSLMLED